MHRLTHEHADALRGWLIDMLGEEASVYHRGPSHPCAGAHDAHRFGISVPSGDVHDLFMLTRFRGTVRADGAAMTLIQIVPEGSMQTMMRRARRDFVLHIRRGA